MIILKRLSTNSLSVLAVATTSIKEILSQLNVTKHLITIAEIRYFARLREDNTTKIALIHKYIAVTELNNKMR